MTHASRRHVSPATRWADAVCALFASLFLLLASPAFAQTFPALTGPVVDQANVIPDDREAALDAKLRAFQAQTGRQFVIATIADMQGYPIDDYAYRLGRTWGIGEKGANNGIILLLAPNNPAGQRGPRIEVGYGLEPIMTDALSRVIISTQMMPKLREGDIAGAVDGGADAVIQQLLLPPEEAAQRAKQVAAKQAPRNDGVDIGAVIFWLFIFFFFVLPLMRSLFGGKRGRRHGSGPIIIWGGGGDWGGGGGSSWGGGGGGSSWGGGGGSFGGGGASGDW